MKILGLGTLIVGNFQDHLVLVSGLLDEIDVVLRVRLVQKAENPRLEDAVRLGLLAKDVELQIRGMVEQVGVDKEEPRELEHFAHQRAGAAIDLVRVDPGNGISKLSHQLPGYGLNGRTLIGSLQKREHQALVGGEK